MSGATFLKERSDHRNAVWRVELGRRWWIVNFSTASGEYSVANEDGLIVDPRGPLGIVLIEATQN